MTPFGQRIRELRDQRGLTLGEMANAVGVSSAYLSALELGKRGCPSRRLVHQICRFLNIIWDEAEELEALAARSHPKITVDTQGLSPKATELTNLLSETIAQMDEETLEKILSLIKASSNK